MNPNKALFVSLDTGHLAHRKCVLKTSNKGCEMTKAIFRKTNELKE